MVDKTKPVAQAGKTSKAAEVAAEVGVPHSSVDLHYFKRCREPRGDTYSTHGGEAKDKEMAGATQIVTPNKVRELQIVLYRKAKAQPKYRFYVEYLETIGAAGEVAARRFLGLPEKLHTGFDKGTDFRWRGWRVDVKTTVLTRKVGYRYLQWPKTKPVKADIIFMVAVDRERSEAVPIGFALKQELLDAPINSERQYPCYEIPFGSLHPAWEMYTIRLK